MFTVSMLCIMIMMYALLPSWAGEWWAAAEHAYRVHKRKLEAENGG